jgi:membrane protease YdiL (CAAX protease family)
MSNSKLTVATTPLAEPPTSSVAGWIKHHPLISYFVLAFAGTWLVIAPLVLGLDGSGLLAYHLPDWLYLVIYVLGAYTGPMLAAYVVIATERGKPGVRAWLRRFVQWRVGIHWYLVALFGVLVVWLLAYSLVYRGVPLLALITPAFWSVFATTMLVGLVVPGYGEEAGWRGFALPRLQQRYGPLAGSLVLGLLHGLWHLPVFFTPFLGPFTWVGYTTFLLTALAMTCIYTWVYNNTHGSILIAVLVHASINASSTALGEVIPEDAPLSGWLQPFVQDGWLNTIAFVVVVIFLVMQTRGTLSYRGANELE